MKILEKKKGKPTFWWDNNKVDYFLKDDKIALPSLPGYVEVQSESDVKQQQHKKT